jgi:hypothetical protein
MHYVHSPGAIRKRCANGRDLLLANSSRRLVCFDGVTCWYDVNLTEQSGLTDLPLAIRGGDCAKTLVWRCPKVLAVDNRINDLPLLLNYGASLGSQASLVLSVVTCKY